MDPVEINAGAWYLRALRDDDRISDVPALAHLDPSPIERVREADRGWADESSFTWAVCEPTSGLLVALVSTHTTDAQTVRLDGVSAPGADPDARVQGLRAARRFLVDGLGLSVLD